MTSYLGVNVPPHLVDAVFDALKYLKEYGYNLDTGVWKGKNYYYGKSEMRSPTDIESLGLGWLTIVDLMHKHGFSPIEFSYHGI